MTPTTAMHAPTPEAAAAALSLFMPAVRSWFGEVLGEPTAPQIEAWPRLLAGEDVVVAAPTGSGKTLAAFLVALDTLGREALAGTLQDGVQVVYVSPLKALSNDVGKNLLLPLAGVAERLGLPQDAIRVAVRTGDTPAKERVAINKRPPHVLVTTPESLYVLLCSESGQRLLGTARTVILDEIHAVCGTRRGAHLALTVERLDALCQATAAATSSAPVDTKGHAGGRLQRIGLSATQRPIELVAQYLVGSGRPPAVVVDAGHSREIDLAIEMPDSPLESIMSGEVFLEVVRKLAALVDRHTTTLIFVNTRRMAERLAARLGEALDDLVATNTLADTEPPERAAEAHTRDEQGKLTPQRRPRSLVCAHHGSMSKDKRLEAENRLKAGDLRALVATSSLELGIDVGAVDLVCQMGSTKTIAAMLQRVGRAGHHKSLIPKGRLFPLSRDELAEAVALVSAVQERDLDSLVIPPGTVDVVAQHAIAAVAAAGDDGINEAELGALFRRALPFQHFEKDRMGAIFARAADGIETSKGRRGAWLFRDTTTETLRPRRGARLAAMTNGGVIPDMGEFQVIEEPAGTVVGAVHEEFAVESMPGDIFQLGTTSWRIEKVERGTLRVSNAQGQPPSIPFWFGEAPGRSVALSHHVSVVRDVVEDAMANGADELEVVAILKHRFALPDAAAKQLGSYLVAARVALGTLPSEKRIVIERFEDSLGGSQLVLHAPFGSRITRAWGLALRKRFCRSFDFELQAAATEEGIILSVGTVDGVDLPTLARFVTSKNIEEVLTQAILQAPMFGTRFRWNATRSLTVLRQRGGKRLPPGLLRLAAEDALVALFPQQAACAENIQGDREVPDDLLIQQTVDDCLREALDVDGARELLARIESGDITISTVERMEPSPLAMELVGARPYAFLDDVPFEERRVQAVLSRRTASAALEDETMALDPIAVDAILAEVRLSHRPANQRLRADEVWDAITVAGFVRDAEVAEVLGADADVIVDDLLAKGRLLRGHGIHQDVVVAVEQRALLEGPTHELLLTVLRGRLDVFGPRSEADHLDATPAPEDLVKPALERLVREGVAIGGHFDASRVDETVFWSRRLLQRTRRRMLEVLRAEVEPVTAADLMRFLFERHHVRSTSALPVSTATTATTATTAKTPKAVLSARAPMPTAEQRFAGVDGLRQALRLLDGVTAPAAAWEAEILPARVVGTLGNDLDALCLSGEFAWRCRPARAERPQDHDLDGNTTPARPARGRLLVRQTALTMCESDTAALLTPPTSATISPTTATTTTTTTTTEAVIPHPVLSSSAQAVVDHLARRGPSFFRDLQKSTGQLVPQLEDSVAEAIAAGLVGADGFGAVRALVRPAKEKERLRRNARGRSLFAPTGGSASGFDLAGRFTLLVHPDVAGGGVYHDVHDVNRDDAPPTSSAFDDDDRFEAVARLLLRRFGVVFRKLVERDPLLPAWRDILFALRRLEVRGEVRGGRFVGGFSGEQFALPEALKSLRALRRRSADTPEGTAVVLSAADPLNLTGIITPGARVPALVGHKVLFVDGVCVGVLDGDGTRLVEGGPTDLDPVQVETLLRGAPRRLHIARS